MRRLAVAGIVAALVFTTIAQALASQALPLRIERFESRDYPNVALTVSLPNEMVGRPLDSSAFAVAENGVERDVTVRRVTTRHLEVILVIDTSGSMRGAPIAGARDAASAFLEAMPDDVAIGLVTFGAAPVVASELNTDRGATQAAIDDLPAVGETALYDGLKSAAELFGTDPNTRRAVVMLSDGGDTVSDTSIDEAIEALQSSEVRFLAVELQSPENDPEPLTRLASATNGRVVSTNDPESLAGIFDDLASVIVNQYEIRYVTDSQGTTELLVVVQSDRGTAGFKRFVDYPVPRQPAPPATAAPQVAAVSPPPPRPGSVPALGPLASQTALFLGLGVLFVGLAGTLLVTRQSGRPRRLYAPSLDDLKEAKSTVVAGLTQRATIIADRTLQRSDRGGRLNNALDRAGVGLRAGEFSVLAASGVVVAFAAGRFVWGTLAGAVLAAATAFAIKLWLSLRTDRRQRDFADQLGDTLQLLSGSLRAGYGLLQAIEAVAEEAPSPTAEEFHRIKVENHLGRDLHEALDAMAERVGGDDFRWVADAIEIHREIGGDLAEIIDSATATIRERDRIRRQVKALSAEGRMSAVILLALPFVLAGLVNVTNPAYFDELTGSGIGKVLIVLSLVFMTVGVIWIRKLVRVVF